MAQKTKSAKYDFQCKSSIKCPKLKNIYSIGICQYNELCESDLLVESASGETGISVEELDFICA